MRRLLVLFRRQAHTLAEVPPLPSAGVRVAEAKSARSLDLSQPLPPPSQRTLNFAPAEQALIEELQRQDGVSLLRSKFSRQPLTLEERESIELNAKRMVELIQMPHTPTGVLKAAEFSLPPHECHAAVYFAHRPRTVAGYVTFTRGLAQRGDLAGIRDAIGAMQAHGLRPTLAIYTNAMGTPPMRDERKEAA